MPGNTPANHCVVVVRMPAELPAESRARAAAEDRSLTSLRPAAGVYLHGGRKGPARS